MFDPKISQNRPFLSGQIFRNLGIFVRNRPRLTSQPVGPICPNTDPTKALPLLTRHCRFKVTHNSHNSSKKFRSAKGPCPNVDLTSMRWRASLSVPGSDLHHLNWQFCPSDPQPLGPKCPKFVRFSLKHLWELSGVLSWPNSSSPGPRSPPLVFENFQLRYLLGL